MTQKSGIALVVTLLITVAVMILVAGTLFTSLVDRTVAANQQGSTAAYYVAQAGLNHYKTLIFRNLVDYHEEHGEGWCASPVSSGIDVGGDGTDMFMPGDSRTSSFGGGEYTTTFTISDLYIVLTSVGTVGTSQATVQLVASSGAGPSGVWDNAIFAAGGDPGSKAINGNVAVYGSVHIVEGYVELEEDYAVSGQAGVYNNYNGKNDGQGNTDISQVVGGLTGDFSDDLCSKLKIAEGNVYLESSASRVGTASDPIYSVHLGKGKAYEGKANANPVEITDHHSSDRINLKFPTGSGLNTSYHSYRQDLPELHPDYPNELPEDSVVSLGNDECEWPTVTEKIQGKDTTVLLIPPPVNPGPCESEDNSSRIEWVEESAGGYLRVEGNVNVGDLPLHIVGPVEYVGRGSLRAGKDASHNGAAINVTGSLVPRETGGHGHTGDYLDGNGSGIALISSGDVGITATASDNVVAAVAFAGRKARIQGQATVVGSIVAESFNIGSQVPKIAYHRDVGDFAEILCLPGSFCSEGTVPPNPGVLSDLSIERR